jgi:molybdenum cofactor cytidylyltransferase
VSEASPKVAIIVLAAGSSSRLGQPKQLLRLSGRPLLERTLDVARATQLEPRILVVGGYADEVLANLDTATFDVVHNPEYQTGQASSLRAGIAALPGDVDGVVIMLGDQPLVQPWLVDDLADHFNPAQSVAVRPRYEDGPGNPILLARSLFPELLQIEGDTGARGVLQGHRDRIVERDWGNQRAPRDVDSMEDYAALLLDWSASGAPDVPRYCQRCGSIMGFAERHGRYRPVCPACGFTAFYDPKIASAVVVEIDGQIVLQRRAIAPGRGKWTFPGGYVDRGERIEDAAVREVVEEVMLAIESPRLIGIYSEPGETVVLAAFHATADGQTPRLGDESTEVRLFPLDDLPELAFHRDQRIIDDWLRQR